MTALENDDVYLDIYDYQQQHPDESGTGVVIDEARVRDIISRKYPDRAERIHQEEAQQAQNRRLMDAFEERIGENLRRWNEHRQCTDIDNYVAARNIKDWNK